MVIIENMDHISLAVSDIERSISFYKDLFGFDLVEKQSGSSEAYLQVGEIKLRLNQVEEDLTAQNNDSYVAFYVDEDDFDDAIDEIEAGSVEIVYGPENIRNGQKVIISDPDGNKIGLCYTK
jgi:metallothiol transferase